MKRFRGGLVFEAHRLLYHSTPGLRVIKKKKKSAEGFGVNQINFSGTVPASATFKRLGSRVKEFGAVPGTQLHFPAERRSSTPVSPPLARDFGSGPEEQECGIKGANYGVYGN